MSVRRRKLPTDDVSSMDQSPRAKKIPSHFTRKHLVIFIVLGVLFLGYIAIASDLRNTRFSTTAIDSLASSFNLQKVLYTIVIDAGSTGTRVLAFKFHSSIINGDLILDNEYYEEIKPGLSSYADNIKEGVKSIEILLDKAKKVVPQSLWSQTPLSIKATAGLRLLPEHKANAIIDECRLFLNNSGFLVNKDSVGIMGGVDEGIYAWFTVNFLMNHLRSHKISNTVAVLDLGGGSTQVTYIPDDEDLKKLHKYIYTINTFNHNLSLYTHSYLGMGLMAARKAILTLDVESNEIDDVVNVHSDCINPIISTQWSYGGFNYLVRGPVNATYKVVKTQNYAGTDEKRPIVKADNCRKLVKRHVDTIENRPIGLKKLEIYAISYYFDRATEAGLIDPFKGGVITLDTFYRGTLEACSYPNTDQPFTCLDMMYIHVLLQDCFGLDGSTKLNLYRKYEDHELSWALGAAFSILQSDF